MVQNAPTPDPCRDEALKSHRILVVEADPAVSASIGHGLREAGFTVDVEADGLTAIETARRERPGLVIMDRAVPTVDGLTVCRYIRWGERIPVIMLAAPSDEHDRIDGLEAGADEYLDRAVSPRELILRAMSVLRLRSDSVGDEAASDAGEFHLDHAARKITRAGEGLPLTLREFDLLAFLIEHPGRVFAREDLLRSVWGWEFGDLSTVTVHVRRLREKIETDPAQPTVLATVWGMGYRFDPAPAAAN
jgi:DNA-binding response OmpR family regulator